MKNLNCNLLQTLGLLILGTFAFSACTKKEANIEVKPSASATAMLVQKNTFKDSSAKDVPYRMYQLLSSNPTNVNFSPLSLNMAFAQVYLGSTDATQETLEQIFGFKPNGFLFESEMKLARELEKIKDDALSPKIYFANSTWVRGDHLNSVLLPFKQDLSKYLDSSVQKLDLKSINTAVADATQQKIKNLLTVIDPGTLAIFVNALYLKADWAIPFKAERTLSENFRSSPHLMVKAEMMHQNGEYRYFEDKTSQWISLSYKGAPLEMLVGLPSKKGELSTVEKMLTADFIASVIKGMKSEKVNLALPKFKFDSKTKLKQVFIEAGYADLFKPGSLNRFVNPAKNFSISEVLQATAIQVDEKGTEAAAATAIMLEKGSAFGLNTKDFIANEPFLFMIRNSQSGEIYFLGRVLNPLEG